MTEYGPTRYDIREFGASPSTDAPDTDAIQAALDACTDTGGTVYVPPGEFHAGALAVGNDTTIHLEAGATLRFVDDYEAYPTVESRWEGWDQVGFHPCLWIANASTVELTGRGTIDGAGAYWWEFYDAPEETYPDGLRRRLAEIDDRNDRADDVSSFTHRPPLLQVYRSKNVSVSGVTLRNSPFWNTHVVYSEDVTIRDVRIENPEDAPNGDGIDVDSSRHVRISDSFIDAGDDAICIKSGKDEQGRRVGEPTRNVAITNCTIERGHGAVVIGSETAGGVRDVVVSNCTFTDTDRGIRIKTRRGRGGVVEDLRFDSIVMRRVACPFVVNCFYVTSVESDPEPVDEATPTVRNVHFSDVTAREVETAGFLAGLPERHLEGISFRDVRIDATSPLDSTDLRPAMADDYEPGHGFFCTAVTDLSLSGVDVLTREGPAMAVSSAGAVSLADVRCRTDGAGPALECEDVDEVRVRGCVPPASGRTFLRGRGGGVVSLAGNHGDLQSAVDCADARIDVARAER